VADLFEALPTLRRVSHPLLSGRRVRLIGVSAILYDDEAYYFEVNKPRYWARRPDGTLSIGIGGIGGRIEQGEKPLDCLRREMEEELGTGFRLQIPDRTGLIHQWEVVDWLRLGPSRKHPTPYFVNLLPPCLGGGDMPDHLAILTFLGRPRGKPRRRDLFGLLAVERSTLDTFLSRAEWPLEELRALPGVAFDLAEGLPVGCILRPVLTARAFRALWFAERSGTP
jgi:8-oxo-dGTP pyrophosphatase MutT (NUDIX family)